MQKILNVIQKITSEHSQKSKRLNQVAAHTIMVFVVATAEAQYAVMALAVVVGVTMKA